MIMKCDSCDQMFDPSIDLIECIYIDLTKWCPHCVYNPDNEVNELDNRNEYTNGN